MGELLRVTFGSRVPFTVRQPSSVHADEIALCNKEHVLVLVSFLRIICTRMYPTEVQQYK